MEQAMLDALYDYAVAIRREIHEYPEVGFELPRTTALVEAELTKMGIVHTGSYGTCSVVADVGAGDFCLALRADMDALPVEEKVDVPFRSKIPGAMHACGHDSHTAVLLAVAKYLKAHEAELPCRVRLIFQPSEEGAISGAEMMVDHGVMDGVDLILASHCENDLQSGLIGCRAGDYQAACIPATIRFLGKTAHATKPEQGVDAIAMAHEAYARLKTMVKEEAGDARYIWSVGRFSGGHVHNVIADCCEMDISFRFYDMDFAGRVEKRVHEICTQIAAAYGGSTQVDFHMSTGPVYNDEAMVQAFTAALGRSGVAVQEIPLRMSSEDFGWYLLKAPGMLFRFGTRNEATGCTALAHCNDFCIDESGMKAAIRAFVTFVMNGKYT